MDLFRPNLSAKVPAIPAPRIMPTMPNEDKVAEILFLEHTKSNSLAIEDHSILSIRWVKHT